MKQLSVLRLSARPTSVGLILCAALSILTSACARRGVVPPGIRAQCITVGMGEDVWPSSGTVDAFLQSAASNDFTIDEWRSSGGQYALGATKDSPTDGRHRLRFLMHHVDLNPSKCPDGSMVVTEVTLDDQPLSRGVLGGIVAQWGTPPNEPAPVASTSPPPYAAPPAPSDVPPPELFAAADRPPDGKASIGRCHMDSCSWGRVVSRKLQQSSASGKLVRLMVTGGESADESSPVKWDASPHETFVFCSLSVPAVIIPTGTGYQVDVIDFINGPSGVMESAASLYSETCHGKEAIPTDEAQTLGYQSIPEDLQTLQLSSPQEILSVANR